MWDVRYSAVTGLQDHFLQSARKAGKDKTGLDVVRRKKLMIDYETQQAAAAQGTSLQSM